MLHDIVEAQARDEFRLWVKFEDGLEGEVDLSDLVGRSVFKRWEENPSEFARVSVDADSGTAAWPGGLDVAPDALYEEILRANSATRAESRSGGSHDREEFAWGHRANGRSREV